VLRVALDAMPLLGPVTGVGVFTRHAMAALADVDGLDVRAFALTYRGWRLVEPLLPDGVRPPTKPMPAALLKALWKRMPLPPVEWWTGAVDVVHGTNFVVPPARRAAAVATVHDLTCLHFPAMCTPHTREYAGLVRRAVGRGGFVHTPSQFVADEVVELLGVPAERVRAVAHGVPPSPPPGATPLVDGPYVLALGTIEPRKGLDVLVRAFDAVAVGAPDLRLVVAGPEGWGMEPYRAAVAAAHHRDRVIELGWVDDLTRSTLLAHARMLAYPSVYEGFGLPPLEAMRAGIPVVTTDAGALREVSGDAARVVPVGDVDALADAIAIVLADDGERQRLIARGLERVQHFSWERCAAGLAGLYRDAAAGGK
jgi:glycosyltransferase involved in cell wall biosynthesis